MQPIRQYVSTFLATLQQTLFPGLETVLAEPLTPEHERVAAILELVQVERELRAPQTTPRGGRPPRDRRKLGRAYLAKAALGLNETEDLYHRLNVIRIELPPLRARREDVGDLLDHYLRVAAQELGVDPKTLSPSARARLEAYHWQIGRAHV